MVPTLPVARAGRAPEAESVRQGGYGRYDPHSSTSMPRESGLDGKPYGLTVEAVNDKDVNMDGHADVSQLAMMTELVVVCGHAICTDSR